MEYISNEDSINFYNEMIKRLDKNSPIYKEEYVGLTIQLEKEKLISKYERDSWKSQVISSNAEKYIYPLVVAEGVTNYEQAKKE